MSTRAVTDVPIVFKSGTLKAGTGFFSLFTFLQESVEEHFILLYITE